MATVSHTISLRKEQGMDSGQAFIFLIVVLGLAMIGFRKMAARFDAQGKVKKAATNSLVRMFGRLFK